MQRGTRHSPETIAKMRRTWSDPARRTRLSQTVRSGMTALVSDPERYRIWKENLRAAAKRRAEREGRKP